MKKMWLVLVLSAAIVGMTACTRDKNGAGENNGSSMLQENGQGTVAGNNAQAGGETGSGGQGGENILDETTEESGGWSEEMTKIRGAVVDALGENYWPDAQIVPEMLEGTYGITPDMYDDYMGESPMISANVDTLLIIKAKDDKVEAVEEALNAYRDMLVNDTMQYPMNLGKIQASRIQRYGNYVCFVQLGADTTAAEENGEEAVITYCQEQNELALEVIAQNMPSE